MSPAHELIGAAAASAGVELGDLEGFLEELQEVRLSQNPTPRQLREAVAALDRLYSRVLPEYVKAKIVYESIEDLTDEVVKTNKSGSNESSRTLEGYRAARQYKLDGRRVNLLELRRYARARYTFLQGILRAIEKKHERLITIEGAYKIEAELA